MRGCRWLATLGVALLLCSCIDFYGQTLAYRYDRTSDTLLMFIVYEALHIAADDKAGMEGPPELRLLSGRPSNRTSGIRDPKSTPEGALNI